MEIKDFILKRIRERGEYTDTASSFVTAALLDSFDFIALLTDIEEAFGIRFDLTGYEPDYFTTADGLAEIADGRAAGRG